MTETIFFNGRKYNDISEMPSSVRQMVENLSTLVWMKTMMAFQTLFSQVGCQE
jgi:hypothetical protein